MILTTLIAAAGLACAEKYMVIDLSGGANAKQYPVTYLSAVPEGGWSDEYKTEKLVLKYLEPGTFTMGDQVHGLEPVCPNVTISKGFWIGIFEITQRQWELVMATSPAAFKNAKCGASRPVEQIDFNSANGGILNRLRAKTGLTRINQPTEAQWEYAARAGTNGDYGDGSNFADAINDAKMSRLGRYWWNGGSKYNEGSRVTVSDVDTVGGTAKVGSYQPNKWGLYDMHGNVWEWCRDWYGPLKGNVTDPTGSETGLYRVCRGGNISVNAEYCTSWCRHYASPVNFFDVNGLRIVCDE